MSSDLRLALVGGGGIAQAHAHALPAGFTVVAVCDPRRQAAEEIAAPFGAEVYGSVEDLLAGTPVDAAIIGTPHFLHFPQAIALARRGVHLLVEKPVTCTSEDLRALASAATGAGVVVLPGQTRRFLREVEWGRWWLRNDPALVGEITGFHIQSLQDVADYTHGSPHWILDKKLAGGGVGMSLAVHQIDLVRALTGLDYTDVSAVARFDAPFINGAESSLAAQLVLGNGAIGTLQASYQAVRSPFAEALYLFGEMGSVAQHPGLGEPVGPLRVSTGDGWRPFDPAPGMESLSDNPFTNEQKHFRDVIVEGVEPAVTLADNFNTIATVEALMLSAESGESVAVARW